MISLSRLIFLRHRRRRPAAARFHAARHRRTPAFMPVGTGGTVKAMYMDQVREAGADIILGNTYHLMLRPGASASPARRPARLRPLAAADPHRFRRLPGHVAGEAAQADEQGVTFRSHIDGAAYELSPERSIEIQGLLDSDIQMQLDECVALPAGARHRARDGAVAALGRALQAAFGEQPGKAMFGIVQGGDDAGAARALGRGAAAMDLKGYAVGGLAVGEPQAVMLDMLDGVCPLLPPDKPRYLMGVGTPDDILNRWRAASTCSTA
jgi:queuine tRNA-ribosyltransferase